MQVTGTIATKFEAKNINTGSSDSFLLQGLLVETEDSQIHCTASGKMIEVLKSYNEGDKVDIEVSVRSKEHNSRWYNEIRLKHIAKSEKAF